MPIEPNALQDLIATQFRDRARFRAAMAHVVSSVPDLVCIVPIEGRPSEYAVGDTYIARLWQGDSCGFELRQLTGIASARVTLDSNPAVAYMVGAPRGSHLETLHATTVLITWEDNVVWTLGGPDWASAFVRSGHEIEPALDLIWGMVRRLSPQALEIGWPVQPSA